MTLEVILKEPSDLGSGTISLRVEKLTYGVHRDIIVSPYSKRDVSKTGDVTGSLLNIDINGIFSSVSDMEDVIDASRTWWLSVDGSGDVTKLPSVKWRDRSYQYCEIENLSIIDDSESDAHEFEYSLGLALDTRTS